MINVNIDRRIDNNKEALLDGDIVRDAFSSLYLYMSRVLLIWSVTYTHTVNPAKIYSILVYTPYLL